MKGVPTGSVFSNARSALYPQLTWRQRMSVWGVHAFTMTGVVWASLAIISLAHGEIVAMWGWLGLALVVDAIDGTLARRVQVSDRVPWFDGTTLDMIVDYITWTFIPAIFMYLHVPLGPKPLAMTMMILICVSSTFCYCNTGMKAPDQYFVGFPAAWNIVAAYLWILSTPAWFNVGVTVLFVALTASAITFVHPFRVRSFAAANIIAVAIWLFAIITLIITHPLHPLIVLIAWWGAGAWLAGVSAWRTVVGIRKEPA